MDYLAVVSLGVYLTGTPTAKHRAGQFAFYGLLTGSGGAPTGGIAAGLGRFGMDLTMT